ncbi:hypothetical protein CAC42_5478 [Sphaceloma murrayae]|uniref:Sphingoid long-chain base transporter RSB1 n=1 Tax=Sphaceloma murrayae TaxID=2082308 RepID=A0A2K1QJJ7_9PEZI|nr:hypothetical protein CAC42_5478 [Sphaceloma murrayae]
MSNSPIVQGLNGPVLLSSCTVETCPMDYAQLDYIPSLGVNATYIAVFVIFLVVQAVQGFRYKTWGYTTGMILGLMTEILGYGGRLGLYNNVFSFDWFVMYLVCLTIGPAFMSASIYLCLSRIVVAYGEDIAPFRPSTYTITFICCDIVSLVLQSAGGAIASTANDKKGSDVGVDVMIVGLAFQVISLTLYMIVAGDFLRRVRKASVSQLNASFQDVRDSKSFKWLIIGLAIATLFIFIRCVYRVAELSEGFSSELANDEVAFNILEGPMIIIAVIALTVVHPGKCFAGYWSDANWTWRQKKQPDMSYAKDSSSSVEMVNRRV